MSRPAFPLVWDASALSSFRSCPRRFFYTYVQHWKPKVENHHLHAGKSFAAGLEAARRAFYERGLSAAEAQQAGLEALLRTFGDFAPPDDSPKSLSRTAGALTYYLTVWPLGADPAKPARVGERLAVEFSFAEPLPISHPETGEPLIYCGRADQICEFAGGLYVEDDKTTSQLGASWSRQWDLRSQFTGYCWAARATGVPVQGVLVRGVSILKTKYEHAEVVTYRPEWQVQRWLEQTCRDIERAIGCWRSGVWDWALDHACTEYGGCQFRQACMQSDPQPILDTYFEQRYWNPLTREETPLNGKEAYCCVDHAGP